RKRKALLWSVRLKEDVKAFVKVFGPLAGQEAATQQVKALLHVISLLDIALPSIPSFAQSTLVPLFGVTASQRLVRALLRVRWEGEGGREGEGGEGGKEKVREKVAMLQPWEGGREGGREGRGRKGGEGEIKIRLNFGGGGGLLRAWSLE
ncbi:Hypothetical protein NocV09_06800010, partial [Nannochloropsis oceanica]